ncbi:MAG: putative hydrolase [uncultured marine phage]|uniref:Putative hydrolase n=1 Tax=uncultured marine phage TaxID=707152 RepID=A0A8D9CEH1_9VIRU|nr:MAG: putative hydrolase [uncultured marine phage]
MASATVDLSKISFSNANEINDFFKQFDSGGFIPWFNSHRQNFIKKGRPLNAIKDERNWQKFWNLIPVTYGKNSINLAEFLTVNNIVCIETGSAFVPKTERVGTSGHPGIAYAFDKVKGIKGSYNTLSGNISAFELFNNDDYINAHGNKTLSKLLKNTTDTRWDGEAFPVGFSGNGSKEVAKDGKTNGFIVEADFMKFRGRGFIQSTGRSKYDKLVTYVKNYKGENKILNKYKSKWSGKTNRKVLTQSSNRDWDKLFQDTDLVLASFAVNQFHESRSDLYYINISSDRSINDDTFNAGWRTNGSRSYGQDVQNIVNTQLSDLAIIPETADSSVTGNGEPGEPFDSGGGSQSPDGNNTQNTDFEDNKNDNGYPNDLPKVEGLTNFFRPDIKIEPIKFDLPADEERKKEVASTVGYQPFVWYLSYQLKFIKSLILSSKGLLPTIKLVFTDTLNLMTDDGFPLDDSKIKVFLNSRTPSLRPIFMEFKIVNFSRGINNTFTIEGVCNVNKFFLREFEAYTEMTSFECLQEFARKSQLGFNSNVGESDDRMNWINPGKRGLEFVKDVVATSYRSDESFIWCYVDYYYNLNYIDVEEALKIDITDQSQVKNSGLEAINQVTNNKEEVSKLWLSNDPSMDQTNQYFDEWKIVNNSTSISLQNGYLNKAKFYDINNKDYLIFDIDSITSEGDKSIIMKGSPQDMEFFENHVRPTYVGRIDTDNMHENYNYSIVQNEQNIKDLQKIGVVIKLNQPNYNLYRYQKIKVVFSGAVSTPSASQINNRLSGEWLIIDIEHISVDGDFKQKVTLIRRELDLSTEELAKEKQTDPSETNQNTEGTETDNTNPVVDEDGEVVEDDDAVVVAGDEITEFSYDLKFKNSGEIDEFFNQYSSNGFIGWFNREFQNDPDFTANPLTVVGDSPDGLGNNTSALSGESGEIQQPINKNNWSKVWNSAIDLIYNDKREGDNTIAKEDFNVIEYIALNTMIYYLAGYQFKPKTDNREIIDLFASNNTLTDNLTAYDSYNDDSYVNINKSKPFAKQLQYTMDDRWQGDIFPLGFSGDNYSGGFLDLSPFIQNGDTFEVKYNDVTETYTAEYIPSGTFSFTIVDNRELDYGALVDKINDVSQFDVNAFISNSGFKREVEWSDIYDEYKSVAISSNTLKGAVIKRNNNNFVGTDGDITKKETSKSNNEFITNTDFFKFRERGLLKFRGRHDYGTTIKYIQNYDGNNSVIKSYRDRWKSLTQIVTVMNISTDLDWKNLTDNTDLVIPTVGMGNVMWDLKNVHIIPTEGRNEQQIFKAIENVGKLVEATLEDPADNFVDRYVKMVRKQVTYLNSKELRPANPPVTNEQLEKTQPDPQTNVEKNPKALVGVSGDISRYKDGGKFDSWRYGKKIGTENTVIYRGVLVATKIAPYLESMLKAGKDAGIAYSVNSAFRTNEDQFINGKRKSGQNRLYDLWQHKDKKKHYTYKGHKPKSPSISTTGNLAAFPGRSNHQNGRAVDLSPTKTGTAGYKWMVENAWKYGFVRTVKKERWHWEYRPGSRMFDFVPQDHSTWDSLPQQAGLA